MQVLLRNKNMNTFINANIVLTDKILANAYLQVEGSTIASLGAMDELPPQRGKVIDCQGQYLAPGFIDTHTHGGGGHDFMDGTAESFAKACRMHMHHGTTTLLPTTLTSSDGDLFLAIDLFKQTQKARSGLPNLPGMHLEGPYFCMEQKGAQPEQYIQSPSPAHYEKIMDYAEGAIARWSVAPELPGALQMAKTLSQQGVVLSIAHSDATYEQVVEAVNHGFTHITHFYSAMSGIVRQNGYRVLGIIESGYLLDELTLELIADGIHLPPTLLRLILKCKNHDSISLVTDSMRAAGMPNGPSILGSLKNGSEVIVEDGIAKMPDRSCFAGSVATADRLVRVMVQQAGLRIEQAVKMMSLNPAKVMGYDKRKGSLEAGKDADLVVFDHDITVQQVYVMGEKMLG